MDQGRKKAQPAGLSLSYSQPIQIFRTLHDPNHSDYLKSQKWLWGERSALDFSWIMRNRLKTYGCWIIQCIYMIPLFCQA